MDSRSAQLREFLRKYSAPHSLIALEAQLAGNGLLSLLEKEGMLPLVVSPNPHHPEGERQAHEQWWNEHADARATYRQAQRARDNALALIQLGSVVGTLAGKPAKPK